MMPKLPSIACYHAEIHVRDGDKVVSLLADRPDWASDVEVVRDLMKLHHVGSLRELVEVMKVAGQVRVEGKGFSCVRGVFDINQSV